MAEASANVVVGYALAIVMQIAVFQWFGTEAAWGEHLAIKAAFVGVSLTHASLLRRLYERIRAASPSDVHAGHAGPEPPHR